MTFFVAAIVLDENRIADNRQDCCTCLVVKKNGIDNENDVEGNQNNRDTTGNEVVNESIAEEMEMSVAEEKATPEENKDDPNTVSTDQPVPENKGKGDDNNNLLSKQPSVRKVDPNIIEQIIEWYAEFLMQPVVKAAVIVAFVALAGLCAWSASQLTQFFDAADVMPEDSYATEYIRAREEHSKAIAIDLHVYFRSVDQSLPSVQEQMKAFVDDLVTIEAVPSYPPFFWLNHFEIFVQANNATVGYLPFNDQLDEFFAVPEYDILYNKHIAQDPTTGSILTSRVSMSMNNVDIGKVEDVVNAFKDQSCVTDAQEVNRGKDDYPFLFTIMSSSSGHSIWPFQANSFKPPLSE